MTIIRTDDDNYPLGYWEPDRKEVRRQEIKDSLVFGLFMFGGALLSIWYILCFIPVMES